MMVIMTSFWRVLNLGKCPTQAVDRVHLVTCAATLRPNLLLDVQPAKWRTGPRNVESLPGVIVFEERRLQMKATIPSTRHCVESNAHVSGSP